MSHAPLRPPMHARVQRRLLQTALAGTLLAATLVLQGCASAPESRAEAAAAQPLARPKTVITPQLQAELDAAMALVRAERYEPGLEALGQLAARMPDSAIPLINMALVHKQLGKHEKAEAQLKQALVVEPGDPLAGNELALLYRKQGRFAEARPIYESVLARYPNFAIAHKNLAVLCDLYLRDYECALCHYKHYSASVPDDKNAKIWIADLQKRLAASK